MGYIPADARWYIAEIILEHLIEDDPRNVVHVNVHLVEASSPDEAYEKAVALGRSGEMEYENTSGGTVRVVFRGLRDLNVVHEALEDGAEIMYEKHIALPENALRGMAKEREALGVFGPIGVGTTSDEPDLMFSEVLGLLRDQVEGLWIDPN